MKIDLAEIRTLIHIVTKRTGTPLHDEDLEQDIALRALEASQRRAVTHPRALLMKIVHDTVHDHWRRRRASPSEAKDLDDIDERFVSHVPAFESDLDRRRRAELVYRALRKLPSSKRRLLELYYIHDHAITRIAEIQGRSVSAIKMDLTRSRRSLAQIVRSLAIKRSR